MTRQRYRDVALVAVFVMTLYDATAHLGNLAGVPVDVGIAALTFEYGSSTYEVFWFGYWALATVVLAGVLVAEVRDDERS